ncbi:MAG: flagellar export chaperone FliS [Gammaproteobacteria bacterium]|nr:flagellar export chaperone FliS [Gammaproteobacteria bacterium]
MNNALDSYKVVGNQTGVVDANPHRLIQMLFEGALDRLNMAKGFIEHDNIEARSIYINKAISIIGGLQSSLNNEAGGEIADNLDSLYDYLMRRLYDANRQNSIEMVEEVLVLLKEIKSGWDSISENVN